MRSNKLSFYPIAFALILTASCSKKDSAPVNEPMVNFIYRFDSTQVRLNSIGQPSPIAAGNAAQSPKFNVMSSHYLELSKDQFTPLGSGAVLYRAAETTAGGANAIDFSK